MSLVRYARSTTFPPTTVMKTIRKLLLFSLLPTVCSFVCSAATHVVLPGQSLQAAINGAASGDTIVLPTTGAFPENITITGKALRIRGLRQATTT